ncbi:MAG: hypothetical protein AAF763_13775, partial [Pseudomonadota bacterium]
MRNVARVKFDKDAPLETVFFPLYSLAELFFRGFQSSDFTRVGDQGRQTLQSQTGLSVEMRVSLRQGRDGLRPDDIQALRVFWQGEPAARFTGLAMDYDRLVGLLGDLEGEPFVEVLGRVGALQTRQVVGDGSAKNERVEGGG